MLGDLSAHLADAVLPRDAGHGHVLPACEHGELDDILPKELQADLFPPDRRMRRRKIYNETLETKMWPGVAAASASRMHIPYGCTSSVNHSVGKL